jgi:dihydrofolate synthase/folylpolyglutamate synthase
MKRTFSSAEEAFSYIESFTNLERGNYKPRMFRLDRMRRLLALFGNPHAVCPSLHLAGSKGKGSCAAFIAHILGEAGYRVGLYTSPHVASYTERFTVFGSALGDQDFIDSISYIRSRLLEAGIDEDHPEMSPTTFELLTLLAFLLFRDKECRYMVIETGIGGRLDATNVITPLASIITPIEREHTDYLGSELSSIAREKGGIIKPGRPVFCAEQKPAVSQVLSEIAAQNSSPFLSISDAVKFSDTGHSSYGSSGSIIFSGGCRMDIELSMFGSFQLENAALAAVAVKKLFPEITGKQIQKGLKKTALPGRMERIMEQPPVYLDGAHTPRSIALITQTFKELHPGNAALIFGCVEGKDYEAMAEILARDFSIICIVKPGSFKKSDPPAVYREFLKRHKNCYLIEEPGAALEEVMRRSAASIPILITGSFYLAGEIKHSISKRGG